jgi:type IV fimbrial biogenesis protein FimT
MLFTTMKAKQSGFTLLEMMLAIALLAGLISIGIPNFRDFVRNARMAAAANDLLADMNLARSEAIKRRVPVTLCKSDDGETCDDDDDTPFRGWIVFVDGTSADAVVDPLLDPSDPDYVIDPAIAAGNAVVDDDEIVLRSGAIAPQIMSADAVGLYAVFASTGFVRQDTDALQRILFCDERGNVVGSGGNSAARGVAISATGRPVVARNIAQIDSIFGGCEP